MWKCWLSKYGILKNQHIGDYFGGIVNKKSGELPSIWECLTDEFWFALKYKSNYQELRELWVTPLQGHFKFVFSISQSRYKFKVFSFLWHFEKPGTRNCQKKIDKVCSNAVFIAHIFWICRVVIKNLIEIFTALEKKNSVLKTWFV